MAREGHHLTIDDYISYDYKIGTDDPLYPLNNGLNVWGVVDGIHNCIFGTDKKSRNLHPGELRHYNSEIAQKEFYRYTIKKIYKSGSKEATLGKPIVSFLSQMDDGLIFVLIFYLIVWIFVATVWFLICRIDGVLDELKTQNFTGAFYPITFFIALIAGNNLRKAVAESTSASKKYRKLLTAIEWTSYTIFTIYQNTFGVDMGHDGSLRFRDQVEWNVSEEVQRQRRIDAESHRKYIKNYLLTLAYHLYATFGDHDLNLDANYFQFKIYRGEALLDGSRAMEDIKTHKYHGLKDPCEELIPQSRHTLFQSPLFKELVDLDKNITCEEKIIVEYHMAENIRKKAFPFLHVIRSESLHITKHAIVNIMSILANPIYHAGHIGTAQQLLQGLFLQIMEMWTDGQIREPRMYNIIFNTILIFYLGILAPMQVISSTNPFWGLFIIPIIIMIYVAPIIVSNWIGQPFKKNKLRSHPPHRQSRGVLCQTIANMFGDKKRVVYSSLHHKFYS